jgi:hypothetical protein
MNRTKYRWIINPLFLLFTATCGDNTINGSSCLSGVDSDSDGLTDDVECSLGTDPNNADSDGDGVSDGQEVSAGANPNSIDSDGDGVSDSVEFAYPKACISSDNFAQRRPAPACTSSADCQPGEMCKGLDPTQADSDGDGVPDGQEDRNFDGTIDSVGGETDPRLWDTDGDGSSDKDTGSKICRPDGLGNVTIDQVSGASHQLGYDPVFGTDKKVQGANNSGAIVVDDSVTGVAGLSVSKLTSTADVRADATAAEAVVTTELPKITGTTVIPVLVGRALTTHENFPAVTSTYRITTAAGGNSSKLRDQLVNGFIAMAAPGGSTVGAATEFYLDITTVRRTGAVDIIIAVSPRALYDDATKPTAIRVNDLVNSTGVAAPNKTLDYRCQGFKADRNPTADFLWTVDTSGSMGPYQAALGNTANAFVNRLKSAGVDMRVGVFDAGHAAPNLVTPGFKFINGSSATPALDLCRQVTSNSLGKCPLDATETLSPYAMPGNNEEPIAGGVVAHDLFKKNAAMGNTNLDQTFRAGATKVIFGVTDEPGSNDYSRYFQTASDPDTGAAFGTVYNTTTLANIVNYYKRNNVLLFGYVPVNTTRNCTTTLNVSDLPRCVIETAGGAAIPISTTFNQADIDAGMNRIVDAVAGAASQYKLLRSPITSTIKVNVRNTDVPRSRLDGFDYDPVSKAIVFYGTNYRPQIGDQVYISYRVWAGSTN